MDCAIVLAAGEGTRMKSATPKVLHEIAGRSLLGHVLAAVSEINPAQLCVVVGAGREAVESHLTQIAPTAKTVFALGAIWLKCDSTASRPAPTTTQS